MSFQSTRDPFDFRESMGFRNYMPGEGNTIYIHINTSTHWCLHTQFSNCILFYLCFNWNRITSVPIFPFLSPSPQTTLPTLNLIASFPLVDIVMYMYMCCSKTKTGHDQFPHVANPRWAPGTLGPRRSLLGVSSVTVGPYRTNLNLSQWWLASVWHHAMLAYLSSSPSGFSTLIASHPGQPWAALASRELSGSSHSPCKIKTQQTVIQQKDLHVKYSIHNTFIE